MNAIPSRNTILAAEKETGMRPSFLEKDWYNVQLIKHIIAFSSDRNVHITFTGGTSLLKGHNLIQRFSEDLDFIITPSNESMPRSGRRTYRRGLVTLINTDKRFRIKPDAVRSRNESRFFSMRIGYDAIFPSDNLRPFLKVDMRFDKNSLPVSVCPITSFIPQAQNGQPETKIACRSPVETAADKIAALSWRVLAREHDTEYWYDTTTIRHLYDLAALYQVVKGDLVTFTDHARRVLGTDQHRLQSVDMSADTLLKQAAELLTQQKRYATEYADYARNVSFADESDQIAFSDALGRFQDIARAILTDWH